MDFFDSMADYYDDLWGEQGDQDTELAFLTRLAGDGPILDVGVGTGRLAIPLARKGYRVVGVDSSRRMLGKLSEKLSADPELARNVSAVAGRLDLTPMTGSFTLVYCVYHTLFYAGSREEQEDFFRNAARLMRPDGHLVVEAYNPTKKRLTRWTTGSHVAHFDAAGIQLEFYDHEPWRQLVRTARLVHGPGQPRYSYQEDRYLWPRQLDEMADAAGLRLTGRWASWGEQSFDVASSGRSVSLFTHQASARST